MLFTQNACRSLRLLSGNSHSREVLWVRTDSGFFFWGVFTGRTLEVLARGEALVRGEHGPLLHGHPAGHADQARLKVCGSQRARRGEAGGGEEERRKKSGGCNKEDGDRGGGGGGGVVNDGDKREGKKWNACYSQEA